MVNEQTNIQVDVAIGLSGFEQEIIERASPIFIGQQEVFVATAEDLMLMKILADRPQDHQDVKGIIAVQAEQLDWEYCVSAAKRLQAAVDVDLVIRNAWTGNVNGRHSGGSMHRLSWELFLLAHSWSDSTLKHYKIRLQ